MLLCKQVPIALWRQSLSWLRCFVYVQNSRMKLLWVAIVGTWKERWNLHYMLIHIAHQRILQPQSILPAAVSLLCDHHTQLLSLNCIPFLPFSPWWAQFTIWLHSIVSGATPLWLSPMSPFTFRKQAAVSALTTVNINKLRHHNNVVLLHGQCYPRPGAPSQVCVSYKISRPAFVPIYVAM